MDSIRRNNKGFMKRFRSRKFIGGLSVYRRVVAIQKKLGFNDEF